MLCVYCKGPHSYTSCALFKQALRATAKVAVGNEFSGESPTPFVGHANYPTVSVGLLSVPFEKRTAKYDNPYMWASKKFSIAQVSEMRRSMVNARKAQEVKKLDTTHIGHVQEVALATRPVDVDIKLKRRPIPTLTFDESAAPFGPRATILNAKLGSNANTHTKIDKVVSDTDRTASSGLKYLFQSGFSELRLSRLLSVGTLGMQRRRKLVPTRWSITATDDILSNQLLQSVKECSGMHDCTLFEAEYMGNYYYIIMLPLPFQFELFELYAPAFRAGREQYSTDFESHFGRSKYAEECTGGYYTVRLAVAEYLKRTRRQASVFAMRVISEEYTTPLGVWVTRETARMALKNKPTGFSTSDLALQFVIKKVHQKFGINIENVVSRSKLLASMQQTRLNQWT